MSAICDVIKENIKRRYLFDTAVENYCDMIVTLLTQFSLLMIYFHWFFASKIFHFLLDNSWLIYTSVILLLNHLTPHIGIPVMDAFSDTSSKSQSLTLVDQTSSSGSRLKAFWSNKSRAFCITSTDLMSKNKEIHFGIILLVNLLSMIF